MYAPKPGNRTRSCSSDHHSVSSVFFSSLNITGSDPHVDAQDWECNECIRRPVQVCTMEVSCSHFISVHTDFVKLKDNPVEVVPWLEQRLLKCLRKFSRSYATCQWAQLCAVEVSRVTQLLSQRQAMWRFCCMQVHAWELLWAPTISTVTLMLEVVLGKCALDLKVLFQS